MTSFRGVFQNHPLISYSSGPETWEEGIITVLAISGCNSTDPNTSDILFQLPDNNRLALVPNNIASSKESDFHIIPFNDIALLQKKEGRIYNEEEFYEKVRSLGVQYILISNEMTSNTDTQFPWMTNKKFRVCPGNVDHKTEIYYTLLIWDNSINSYHFFKFLYENNK